MTFSVGKAQDQMAAILADDISKYTFLYANDRIPIQNSLKRFPGVQLTVLVQVGGIR